MNDMLDDPNLNATDWFTRAFGITAGIVVAILFGVFIFELTENNVFAPPAVEYRNPPPPQFHSPPASLPAAPLTPIVPPAVVPPAVVPSVVVPPAGQPPAAQPAANLLQLQVIAKATAFLAQQGYRDGIFFDGLREGTGGAPDATHVISGDIRTAASSTPFQFSVRVVPTFAQTEITIERLTVGGARVYPAR